MGLLALAAWLLLHPYGGIGHDGALYTLFALARLHPDNLGYDIFLRFGSQDSYTLFTPIYAALIATCGPDRAAAVLTLLSQAALVACAWLLVRRFASRLEATLGVALLLSIPSEYGAGSAIFRYFEPFLTPRLPAEALTLGALVALLGRRYRTAAACLLAAMLLHPLMGVAGVVLAAVMFVVPARPRLTLLLGAAGLLAILIVATTTGWLARPDATWLVAVRETSYYLFVGSWSSADWSRVVVPLGVLGAGWMTGADPLLRRLCAGALATTACGLAINFVCSDLLHLSLFMSAQTWRWIWLADVIAVTLSPAILLEGWRRGDAGRTGVILLASALLFRGSPYTLYLVPAALASLAAPAAWDQRGLSRPLFFGSCVLLALALLQDLGDRFGYIPVPDATMAALPQQIAAVCADGVLPEVVVVAAWLALRRWRASLAVPATLAAVAACACLAFSTFPPGGWAGWTRADFPREMLDKFAPWRAQMPARSEVFWADAAVQTWALLDRPSYWSPQQMAGGIFSREKALAMQRRARSLSQAARNSNILVHNSLADGSDAGEVKSLGRLNLAGLRSACSDPELGFVVSWQSLAPTRYAPVVIDPSKPHGRLYLYSCTDLRS
jgi:hypothetical protein